MVHTDGHIPLTAAQVHRALVATTNPIYSSLHPGDIFCIRLTNGQTGYVIRLFSVDSLHWAMTRLYEIIARTAIAVVTPNAVNIGTLPLPPHGHIPDRLFQGLGLPRPALIDLFNPYQHSVLRSTFQTEEDAYNAWIFYQDLAREAVQWIRRAHERTMSILADSDDDESMPPSPTQQESRPSLIPAIASVPIDNDEGRSPRSDVAELDSEDRVRFAELDEIIVDSDEDADAECDSDMEDDDGELSAYAQVALSVWSDDSEEM
ncbi:hypothetical protein CVT24_001456 [Panaeolus cyanescens]|uniref:Uncharacterized protein n=1 Tax=Panaeolus cyanescens TaxID=181874 RepID=A0A409WIZ1_9AGAR|nr:hypothetical protein CVT24_001456 [Panaeolus cyanescens]